MAVGETETTITGQSTGPIYGFKKNKCRAQVPGVDDVYVKDEAFFNSDLVVRKVSKQLSVTMSSTEDDNFTIVEDIDIRSNSSEVLEVVGLLGFKISYDEMNLVYWSVEGIYPTISNKNKISYLNARANARTRAATHTGTFTATLEIWVLARIAS